MAGNSRGVNSVIDASRPILAESVRIENPFCVLRVSGRGLPPQQRFHFSPTQEDALRIHPQWRQSTFLYPPLYGTTMLSKPLRCLHRRHQSTISTIPSVITLKPAIRYQFKTGQRDWPKT
jgi:hypothetical protein